MKNLVSITSGALLALLVIAGPAGGAGASAPEDFAVIAKITEERRKGDELLFVKERLKLGGEKAGTAKLRYEFAKRSIDLSGTWRFRDGKVKASGTLSKKNPSTIKIRGGTKAYDGAKGRIDSETLTKKLSREKFTFK